MTPVAAIHRQPKIVVDWSTAVKSNDVDNADRLINWIKTSPQAKEIHVYLGSTQHRPNGRRLQNALLAMGCMVTKRSPMSSVSSYQSSLAETC
ncbi:hypothetical protein HN512_01855 [Candidatus Peregrinibacteria bacterium]|jgi:hypothetical protein|nr:hypothetical protein [Candidatus Peregrinibacteria bacterium]MBT3598558.1 hypothetical protein [Candidatus Peregrinibacteria bacterium]MBT4367413.1 hypothetical protein [Candidatus Peregrinibacteria bacterium]MBT4585293.1 hypothetical protein [Candidatus Peregrinibacteria bacterium]MBT6730553.1 hypothetical protein [Candidatus Peregrinibacteria bacterium]